ncbi:MAG TPA: TolC family protein, partial [Nitrospira sp.]|nr:TolC family protein [Nitrospira sp.]
MKQRTFSRPIVAAAICVVLGLSSTGCLQGQNYHRPPVDTPADWTRMASGPLAAGSSDKVPEADWWQAFHNQELTQFIERALAQNHDIRRAVSRVLEGRASVTTAGAGLYPQLNVQGSYSNIVVSKNTLAGLGLATGQQPGPQVFARPGSSFDLWNGAADLRWELDVWGRIRRGMEAASADAQAIEQDARAIALTLISDVGQSYFRIRELDEQIEIAQRALTLRRDSLDIITKRASVGLASDLDVKRTEVLVAETAGQIPDLIRLR